MKRSDRTLTAIINMPLIRHDLSQDTVQVAPAPMEQVCSSSVPPLMVTYMGAGGTFPY